MSDRDSGQERTRGNPPVCVRLEPEVYELLRQRAGQTYGRAGGMALYVRRLVYQHLGLPLPVQYGEASNDRKGRQNTMENGPTLHAELEAILRNEGNRPLSSAELADLVNQRGNYVRGDGEPVPPKQVAARVNNYDIFERTAEGIRLVKP